MENEQKRNIGWDSMPVFCIFTILFKFLISIVGRFGSQLKYPNSYLKLYYVKLSDVSYFYGSLITVFCNDEIMVRSMQRYLAIKYFILIEQCGTFKDGIHCTVYIPHWFLCACST